jgi:hypothetical protein
MPDDNYHLERFWLGRILLEFRFRESVLKTAVRGDKQTSIPGGFYVLEFKG